MHRRIFAIILLAPLIGCAARRAAPNTSSAAAEKSTAPATQPAGQSTGDPKANLTLDEIEPMPIVPADGSTMGPTTNRSHPPVEALELYARARDALATNHRFSAISSLERAIALDPDSPELYSLMSRAYLASGNPVKAITMLQHACELDPGDGRNLMSLGRLYLLRGDATAAMTSLRLALRTRDYAHDDATAALTDYFLARALQQLGYDRAALDRYEKLLARLQQPNLALRSDRELGEWLGRPEAIFSDVGRLSEKRGQNEIALRAWRGVLHVDPEDFDARAHVANILIALGRGDEALADAVATVQRTNASPKSIALLRDIAHRLNREEAVYDAMRKVLRDRPGDRAALFALADLLAQGGRAVEAEKLLDDAAREKWDLEIISQLVRLQIDQQHSTAAAKLLIEACAARPDDSPQILDMFEPLIEALRVDSLRASDLAALKVPPSAEPARQWVLARIAEALRRRGFMQESLDRAVRADPVFAPALRTAMQQVLQQPDADSQHNRDADALIARAEKSGQPNLVDELRAIRLLYKNKPAEALAAFTAAGRAHPLSPESSMLLSRLLISQRELSRYEQLLWKVISDHPDFDLPYQRLIEYYGVSDGQGGMGRNNTATLNVIQRWLANNPASLNARLVDAQLLAESGALPEAMTALADLMRQNPNNRSVFAVAQQIFARDNSGMSQYMRVLEQINSRWPQNIGVADEMARMYQQADRHADALKIIDAIRDAARSSRVPLSSTQNVRLQYLVGQLYARIDERGKANDLLEAALKLDPNDAVINNDLGYTWADQNLNLDRAEQMIRKAVQIEPDNPSFLDSLGWVLYKRGQFAQARQYLQQALLGGAADDPTVLDHLGDALYRMHDNAGAVMQWQRSYELLPDTTADLIKLRRSIEQKLNQQHNGEPVEAAPIGIQQDARQGKPQD